MFDTFTEVERKWLMAPCGFWIARIGTNDLNKIVLKMQEVFYQWRDEQADKNGLVKVQAKPTIGILSALQMGKPTLAGKSSLVPVEEMAPWQCAGTHVRNDIDLALKLWIDKYKPFEALIKESGLYTVLSIIGSYSRDEDIHSLISLNSILVDGVMSYAEGVTFYSKKYNDEIKTQFEQSRRKEQQQRDNLEKKARPRLKEKWEVREKETKRSITDWLRGKLKTNPYWDTQDAVNYISKESFLKKADGKNPYSKTYLKKLVSPLLVKLKKEQKTK